MPYNAYTESPRGSSGPASPMALFKGTMKEDLVAWFKKQVPRGSRAEGAVGMLRSNFTLARQQKRNNTISLGLSLAAICVVIINYVVEQLALDFVLSILTLLHIACLVDLYVIWFRKEILLKKDYAIAYPSFVVSPLFRSMLFHMFCVSLHAPPFIADFSDGRFRSYLNTAVLLRSLEVLQTVSHYTFVSSAGATLVAALSGEKLGPLFVYKMLLFKYPILTMALTATGGFMILSCATWFFEGQSDEAWGIDRAMWYTIVTFTTVGYGDHVPTSTVGRIIGMISAIFGITASAVLVSVVQHKLALSRIQKQVILFLCEVQASRRIKEASLLVILRAMEYNLWMNRYGPQEGHRSIAGWMTTNVKARTLHAKYSALLAAVRSLKALRSGEDGGTAWADISVLDVLQADTSDILAQNTVLQYFMRPADETLSSQLRATKKVQFGGKKKRETSEIMASPPNRDLEERRPSLPVSEVRSGVEFDGHLQHPLVRPSTPPSPSRLSRRSSSASSGGTQTSEASSVGSHASQGSQRSLRTAASTKALVDLVKMQVAGIQSSVPPQPPKPLEKMRKASFAIGSNLKRIRAQESPAKNEREDRPISPVGLNRTVSEWSNDISTGKDSLGELISEVDSEEPSKPKPSLRRVSSERWKMAAKEALRRDKLEKATINNMGELRSQMGVVMRRQDEHQRTLNSVMQMLTTMNQTIQHLSRPEPRMAADQVPSPAASFPAAPSPAAPSPESSINGGSDGRPLRPFMKK